MTADQDLYTVLDVAPTATDQQIAYAYYAQVRKHPPEKDPMGFRRVQEAFDILGNPETRAEYDEQQRSDPHTRSLVDEGRELLDDSDPESVTPLKRALVRQPDSTVVRDLLVQALLLDEDYKEAEKHARILVRQAPDNAAYHLRLGDVLRADDEDEEAEEPYRRALELDNETPQPVTKLAYLLNYLDREDEAIEVLRAAILRDGRVDFEDFLFFQALCRVYIGLEDIENLEGVHREIRSILPPDPETRAYVAWFYYSDALLLAQAKRFDAALAMIQEAAEIDSSLPELQGTLDRIQRAKKALDEASRLKDDQTLLLELRFAVGTLTFMRVLGIEGEIKDVYQSAVNALDRHFRLEGSPLKLHIGQLRKRYPGLSSVVGDLLDWMEKRYHETTKTLMIVRCPRCGDEGNADIPNIASLVRAGLSAEQAKRFLREKGLEAAKRLMIYECQECGTTYNGTSKIVQRSSQKQAPSIWTRDLGVLGRAVGCLAMLFFFVGMPWIITELSGPSPPRREAQTRTTNRQSRQDAQSALPQATATPSSSSFYVHGDSLNVRNGPGTNYERIAQLSRFDTVQVLGQTDGGWAKVRIHDGNQGFVSIGYLRPGRGDVAKKEWCRVNSGARPSNGRIFRQIDSGPHKLVIKNEPGRDAVFKLKDSSDRTALSFYVRSGESVTISTVPEGTFFPIVASGRSYSAACGYFLEDLAVSRLDTTASFRTTYDENYRYTSILEFTLYRVIDGNLQMSEAPLDEFLDE